MRHPRRSRHRAQPDVVKALALHKALNPARGQPLLVAIDGRTGQLFFTSARGWPSARDSVAADRRPYYDAI